MDNVFYIQIDNSIKYKIKKRYKINENINFHSKNINLKGLL